MLLLLHSGYSSTTFSDDNLVAIRSSTPESELPKYDTDKNKHRNVLCQADALSRLPRLSYFNVLRVQLCHRDWKPIERTAPSVVLVQIGQLSILPLLADSFPFFEYIYAFSFLPRSIFFFLTVLFSALFFFSFSPGITLLQ